jgi:sugar/nucleoside kinase (ribokinase family)
MSQHAPAIDVLGIGNALVDVISHGSHELLDQLGLTAGTMDLIDGERRQVVYEAMGPGIETSGGSAANTCAGLASLGVAAHFIGRVRDDELGEVFIHDIHAIGVGFSNAPRTDGPTTGCCLVIVTPDAQRTMNTFLGASAGLSVEDVNEELVGSAAITYLEGYLFDGDHSKAAFRAAADLARAAGRKVAFTLSDVFCVQRHPDEVAAFVSDRTDVLFANAAEITALTGIEDPVAAARLVGRDCPLVVVTRSEHGAVVVSGGNEVVEVPAQTGLTLVDTTGAGDQFAAGFLAGHVQGRTHEESARMGVIAASECITHIGPRPEVNLAELVAASI